MGFPAGLHVYGMSDGMYPMRDPMTDFMELLIDILGDVL